MLEVGWFSTGRGEGSRGLLQSAVEAIHRGYLKARIRFVFCNREPGEHEGSDRFMALVRSYRIPLLTLSSRRFRKERGAPTFDSVRLDYDRVVLTLIEPYAPQVVVLAGYMLIVGGELCRRYPMLNLHPALPHGPQGTWQEVIWALIAQQARESGAMVHLATEEVDRGPAITYVSFPIQGDRFAPLWEEVKGLSVEEMQKRWGESLALFQAIRQEGMKRERPLLVETLRAFAEGHLRLVDGQPQRADGQPLPLCLNEVVERALQEHTIPQV
ncbi:Phosphoribosylglycinamide formyltransferase [bacterium HR23]|nr:Phosphoribosylglycinamide formyltransferase [bacterium HR23]